MGNELRQSLDDSALAYSWLSYEYGVVLLSSAQYLHHSCYLCRTSHHRVELAVECCLCQVGREVVQYRSLAGWLLRCCSHTVLVLIFVIHCVIIHLVLELVIRQTYAVVRFACLVQVCKSVIICNVV